MRYRPQAAHRDMEYRTPAGCTGVSGRSQTWVNASSTLNINCSKCTAGRTNRKKNNLLYMWLVVSVVPQLEATMALVNPMLAGIGL
jgi:hypothetical protein